MTTYTVVPRGDRWAVRRHGAARASRVLTDKGEALSWALARSGDVLVHRRDGTVEARHGNGPAVLRVPVADEPVLELVERLERLLAEARTGELRGIGYAAIRGGRIATGWWWGDGVTNTDAIAAVSVLQHEYVAETLRPAP